MHPEDTKLADLIICVRTRDGLKPYFHSRIVPSYLKRGDHGFGDQPFSNRLEYQWKDLNSESMMSRCLSYQNSFFQGQRFSLKKTCKVPPD